MPDIECPLPHEQEGERIQRGHGAGTRMTAALLERVIYPRLGNAALEARLDAALLPVSGTGTLAFTTDSYVVTPWHFAGGSIGDLAVCGAVNDLAMVGARAEALSLALIIEEGFLIRDLERIIDDIARQSHALGVPVVTGDTKVVERGKADGVFITMSAVGRRFWPASLTPAGILEGDVLLLSGDVGRHAIAVQAARQGFVTAPPVMSDVMPLLAAVAALCDAGLRVRCLRDLTRGGLGMALADLSHACGRCFDLTLDTPPMLPGVRAVVETLGLDGFFLANEGRFLAVVHPADAEAALAVLQSITPAFSPSLIGTVSDEGAGRVTLTTPWGSKRLLRVPASDPLPRIC